MSAVVVPFPIARRHGFVTKQVAHASLMSPDSGGRYLRYQIKLQVDAMRRRGIDENLVQREVRCMTVAIQAAFAKTAQTNLGGET